MSTFDRPTTRECVTPNAVMLTYASPSLNESSLAVWRTEMEAGASGPLHVVDTDQVVVVLEGRLGVMVDGAEYELRAGAARVLRAGSERRLHNASDARVVTLTSALPGGNATVAGNDPVPISWGR